MGKHCGQDRPESKLQKIIKPATECLDLPDDAYKDGVFANVAMKKLKEFAHYKSKHLIFTEFGYLTVDHCAHKSWELEEQISSLDINQQAQANAFEALFSVFWPEDYWAGGFIWKWFPNMQGHEGYPDKDYTPQGKKSQKIIENWYAADK